VVPESTVRSLRLVALVVLATVVVAGPGAGNGRAADECRGLQVCLPVPGPWVAIPASPGGRVPTAVWEMRCPLRGYIVAGVDARVTDRAIDVSIRGENGAPISPGVTTKREVVFTAVYAGGPRRPTAFQPFIGCIPTSGGGARGETAVKRAAAFPPAQPIERRVVRRRLVSGASTRVVGGCPAGSRLLGAEHAYAFHIGDEPGTTLLTAVRTRQSVAALRVTVVASVAPSVPQGLPVELQLHALCTRVTR
jgi:hypothetical protein